MFGPCRGCLAKDQEIARLAQREAALVDRLLALSGQSPLAVDALAVVHGVPDRPRTCPTCGLESGKRPVAACSDAWHVDEEARCLTIEEQDEEAEKGLRALAQRRDVPIEEFADA